MRRKCEIIHHYQLRHFLNYRFRPIPRRDRRTDSRQRLASFHFRSYNENCSLRRFSHSTAFLLLHYCIIVSNPVGNFQRFVVVFNKTMKLECFFIVSTFFSYFSFVKTVKFSNWEFFKTNFRCLRYRRRVWGFPWRTGTIDWCRLCILGCCRRWLGVVFCCRSDNCWGIGGRPTILRMSIFVVLKGKKNINNVINQVSER